MYTHKWWMKCDQDYLGLCVLKKEQNCEWIKNEWTYDEFIRQDSYTDKPRV